MAVVKQQLESGGTTSSNDEFATVNALNEEETKKAMIRLFNETMWPAYYFEDDSNNGSGGSKSSIGEFASVNAYKPKMELLSRIYNETIYPMFCADIKAQHQNFLSLVKENFGCDLLTGITWDFGNTSSSLRSKALELRFLNGISTPVATGMRIKGKEDKPFVVALVDGMSGKIVKTGAEAAMEVEIVVLEGDTNNDEAENWTSGEWNRTKVLQGKTCVKMKEGVVLLDNISFTHNKVWQENRNCRLGARSVNADFSASVKAGKTELFLLEDKRSRLYGKLEIPFLSDHVYRLREISRRGVCYKRLCDANVKTVMDLLTLHAINPERLKDILKVHDNRWKTIIEHAQKCKDDKGLYLYHHHSGDGRKSHGVVFNISGQLVGLVADSQFVPSDKLSIDKRVDAQKLVISSSEHWEEVVSSNDQPSLISHLQSHTTLNSLQGNLNVVIPQTFDTCHPTSRTSLQVITPLFPTGWCTNNQSNRECDSAGGVGHNQIQSPKRSASEYAISNSPKKPREDRPQISPSTPYIMTNTNVTGTLPQCQNTNNLCTSATTEDDSWLQYIDFSQCDISSRRWKRVRRVVGWISIYSKVRKRRMNFSDQLFETSYDETVFVISASIQRAQT